MDPHVLVNDVTISAVKARLKACTRVLETYSWLINSFVLDYFLDPHWAHLPPSWRSCLSSATPHSLARYILQEIHTLGSVIQCTNYIFKFYIGYHFK